MATDLSPILQATKEILQKAGRKGMHVKEISEMAVAQNNNLGMCAEDFQKKVQAALLGNIKLKNSKPSFAPVLWDKGSRKGKPKQGWYRVKNEIVKPAPDSVTAPQTSTKFIGKAGEYAVMSELLFWEFNASIMTVDDGIDIVASKHNKFFHIQVKTASRQESGKFYFSIGKDSFKKYNTTNVFYVFVMRQDLRNEYIIIPGVQIEYFLNSGIISGTSSLSLTITVDTKKSAYTLNGKANVTPYFGKFGEIIK